MGLIARRFKNQAIIAWLARSIDPYRTAVGQGLPVGTWCRQVFADVYFDGLDHFGMPRRSDALLAAVVDARPGCLPPEEGPGDGTTFGTYRVDHVVRGGSWINTARNCRSAYRNWNTPGNRNDNLGFRVLAACAPDGCPAPDPVPEIPPQAAVSAVVRGRMFRVAGCW